MGYTNTKWEEAGMALLLPRIKEPGQQLKLVEKILEAFGGEVSKKEETLKQLSPATDIKKNYKIVQTNEATFTLHAGNRKLEVAGEAGKATLYQEYQKLGKELPSTMIRALFQLAEATLAGEPVLLRGPTSCKTEVVKAWGQMTGRSSNADATQVITVN